MSPQQERDIVQFRETIIEQKDVKARIDFAEPVEWKPKDAVKALDGDIAQSYKAAKLTLMIEDDTVKTEHADARPKLIVEDQFNVQKYPYIDKKAGGIKWMNRGKLFDLEHAFGFDPCFVDKEGNLVEPFISRTGSKLAPKIEGVARVLNPDFVGAYFHADMTVNPTNWIGKKVLIDVGVEHNETYGSKNIINRYKKIQSI